jgi:signal transduction histidine kinase
VKGRYTPPTVVPDLLIISFFLFPFSLFLAFSFFFLVVFLFFFFWYIFKTIFYFILNNVYTVSVRSSLYTAIYTYILPVEIEDSFAVSSHIQNKKRDALLGSRMEIVNDPDTIINKLYQARQWIYWDSE